MKMTDELETVMGGVRMGVNVDIKRTDGRIHSAVVSGINVETKSVTVEWFERGETKGKEIELEQILGLNQDLAPTSYDNANVIPNKLQKNDNKNFGLTKSYVPRPSLPVANNKAAPAGGGTKRNPGRQSHVVTSNGHNKEQNVENQNGSGPHNNLGNSETLPPPKHVPTLPPEKSETVSKATGAAAAQGVNRRRSNVVKEVERLKENREKRRAQQAQILEEQEQLRNKDPGNPNWEFLQMILDYKDELEFNPLQDGDPTANHQITVCIRKRPMSQKETKKKEVDVVTVPTRDGITIHEPKSKVDLTKYLDNQHFRFDYAFDENANNELVYKYTARSLVQSIFEGGMATCFAYGQTGSGKTHTMGGEFHGKNQDSKNGIYAFATKDVFKLLKSPKYKNNNLLVSCSYFEIYSGKVFDLLSGKSKLRVLEDGKQQVVVVGLTETEVECVEDVLKLITHGNNLRTSGQTSANAHSSRSHAVFQIILRLNNNKKPLYGKFSLIDLAGNERGADTSSANRQTRMEGAEINKSLLALKECIRALGRKGAHLPFRASKLTQVLRDSFIGEKARTCMIAMISPSLSSCEHTLNTLRYADRVKELGSKRPAREGHNGGDMVEYEDDMGDILDDNESGRMEDGVLSPEDSDLAQLRSLNDGECSADWYNFQESVAHLQLLEEEVVESHKNLLDSMEHWIQQDASLLAMTNEVDYDQDAYAQQLEDMISEKQEALEALRDKTRAFRACLNEEEAQSNKMRRN
eukprot:GFUD01009071.1.p1 GENE.GFUD01009071.1~~GFUD01009071.1.p1  ORF type:complete len:751 (+),score=217.39 GFUD01009071.1:276-2528(+)